MGGDHEGMVWCDGRAVDWRTKLRKEYIKGRYTLLRAMERGSRLCNRNEQHMLSTSRELLGIFKVFLEAQLSGHNKKYFQADTR